MMMMMASIPAWGRGGWWRCLTFLEDGGQKREKGKRRTEERQVPA